MDVDLALEFLKFVEKNASIAVYTAGKGCSASELTESVFGDSSTRVYLEGVAMVLADGGVVCIDEFDESRPEDRCKHCSTHPKVSFL